ncbi:ribonuclease-3 [Hydrogenivirga caldilitoris]|uniref:Ribonuclease 3 n=1 Tax=Hydrogenivirga caldilitoris TaxID=246264 RepID=A0A497XQI2_9AQUI|nr:ribonuclease III [Hydrogenivirga caldilitoris]RLJ70389.1 ribonuclease-3 [Hydrogenivirga caldilitoris]
MFEEIEERIGYTFKNKELLQQAFTHVSYARDTGLPHYETLEFLGDALLNFIVVDMLVREFPRKREGTLASLKAYLISEEFFNELANELELPKYILISRGKKNVSIVGDVFEALWAAVYVDSGRDCGLVKELFNRLFRDRIVETVKRQKIKKDYKTMLQEITQKMWRERPTYRVVSVEGPEHAKTFTVESSIKGLSAIGHGKSKKEAEQEAAKKLMEKLQNEG